MAHRIIRGATAVAGVLGMALAASVASAQQAPRPERPATSPPAVGEMAPDFELPGATRYGLLKNPVRLSDFRDQTVVIAFFYRARTAG
jgi:hypothetical protein